MMAADGLTKDQGDATDALRSLLRTGRCQIYSEEKMLRAKATEKQRRKERGEARAIKPATKDEVVDTWGNDSDAG